MENLLRGGDSKMEGAFFCDVTKVIVPKLFYSFTTGKSIDPHKVYRPGSGDR